MAWLISLTVSHLDPDRHGLVDILNLDRHGLVDILDCTTP
jgi:hypothetical protein